MKWPIVKLGSLCDLVNGKAFKPSDWSRDGLPIIRIQNLNDATKEFNYWAGGLESQVEVNHEDVLLAWSGTPGTSFGAHLWTGGHGVLNQHIFRVDLDESRITKAWAIRSINQKLYSLIDQAHGGVGLKHVTKGVVEDVDIPLPSLSEQKRIAGILDQADGLRRKRQQALALTDQFLRSTFLDLFGDPVTNPKRWPEARLDVIADIQSGVTKGRKLNGQQTVSVPYMRVANVQDGHLVLDEIKEIEVMANEVEKFRLKPGDVLLTEGGDFDKLGRGTVWRGEIDPCIHQNHIFRVRPRECKVLPEFLSAILASSRGKRYFLSAAKQTTGIASINKTQLSGFPAFLPPVALQEKFEAVVSSHRKVLDRLAERFALVETLFNSLVQRAFRGDL